MSADELILCGREGCKEVAQHAIHGAGGTEFACSEHVYGLIKLKSHFGRWRRLPFSQPKAKAGAL